jgi:hypothetical protein
MSVSPQLITLSEYLAGEFHNQEQALAEPAWYVHLRLWQRPVDLFTEDSITLFAEQANIVNLERPYRQRIMRLMPGSSPDASLQVQYYMFKDPSVFIGAGCNPDLLKKLTPDQIDLLPGCILTVTQTKLTPTSYQFTATQPQDTCCRFTYQGQSIQVALGFASTASEFYSYDKGIDSDTGKATWGAILGPYRYTKVKQY